LNSAFPALAGAVERREIAKRGSQVVTNSVKGKVKQRRKAKSERRKCGLACGVNLIK
jgi:GTP cyclohydrolase I